MISFFNKFTLALAKQQNSLRMNVFILKTTTKKKESVFYTQNEQQCRYKNFIQGNGKHFFQLFVCLL